MNNISDIESYAREIFNKGFNQVRYPMPPQTKKEPVVEEKIKEPEIKKTTKDSLYDE